MTPQEKALAEWKSANPRRKGTATHYADGRPKVAGKTKKEVKTDKHEAFKKSFENRVQYKTDTSTATPQKKALDWAGDVGRARQRNQKVSTKHYTDKGYREGYR